MIESLFNDLIKISVTKRKKTEPLTVEKLRTYPGLQHLSDEEAQEVLFSLQAFATLLLEIVMNEEGKEDKEDLPLF